MSAKYGKIGRIYSDCRWLDPRIGQLINHALGDAQSVVNVGAGAGSYEPKGRSVAAVEPSVEMIRQRPASAAPVVQGRAEDLPFEDGSFDTAFAALTNHHWSDKSRGCAEMRRLAKEMIVRFTFDPERKASWLPDNFPEFAEQDDVRFPKLSEYEGWSRPIEVTTIPIRHDCTDGFLNANWKRPYAYLDPKVRAAVSPFRALDDPTTGLAKLKDDLDSGVWEERYGSLLECDSCDFGYRLIAANLA